jgi:ABC-type multidrug transport system fused ATPase/permease subunit
MQTAKTADRIYVIENGKINANGTPTKLLETDNFFSQLVADALI